MKCICSSKLISLQHAISQCSPLSVWPRVHLMAYRACSSGRDAAEKDEVRSNPIGIQMLSKSLHRQVFKEDADGHSKDPSTKMKDIEKHLKSHDLWDKETTVVPEVNFDLPKLYGSNIDEHFKIIAEKQCAGYRKKADILTTGSLPYKPQTWAETQGWTRYNADGSTTRVEFPDEDSLVFDVEVLVPESDMPVLATAASPNHWYSWCNQHLIKSDAQGFFKMTPDELIPLDMDQGGWKEKVVVGHNVGFDRSFVKEQYLIKGPKTRFMDTMSMHIAVSGFTGSQRMLWNAKKTGSKSKSILELEERNKRLNKLPVFEWMEDGAPNNLSDVYQHYCQGAPLDKEVREVFLEGTTYELGLNIQNLMSYCADDVIATHHVFQILWPLFQERFPHPVTLAGMLQMGSSYLPLNANWNRYLETAEEIYNNKQSERERMLIKIANDACSLLEGNRYKEDPWLWDLDWSIQNLRIKKTPLSAKKKAKSDKVKTEETTVDIVTKILSTKNLLYKVSAHMPGYPLWFKKFCPKLGEVPWSYGPTLITMRKNDTPKLMRMTWKGFPVHFDDNLGWGYLVPGRMDNLDVLQGEDEPKFPLKQALAMFPPPEGSFKEFELKEDEREKLWAEVERRDLSGEDNQALFQEIAALKKKTKKPKKKANPDNGPWWHKGIGPIEEVNIPGCWFFKIPHKNGPDEKVGNILSRTFYSKVENGVLGTAMGLHADVVLKMVPVISYWEGSRDRIINQMAVWLDKDKLPPAVTSDPDYDEETLCGAILPRIVTAGTVTRRAVEKTWLTASNAYSDRIGSELKAMVQCPPGYTFVGADVDAQELWIASLIGDADFAGIHGSTAFGWMNLQGKKSEGTDLHSKTAETIGITREQAKVFNYGRIYGAGYKYAVELLCEFNPKLTKEEALKKACVMYNATKGKKTTKNFIDEKGKQVKKTKWVGGSESEMFNSLESIISVPEPKTPALGCKISRALEPDKVSDHFMTSRLNWVVQSSGVDYLHLLLVCNQWLFDKYGIDGRFSISIHDEVRYLVKSEDKYRAALALQISNLLTRCMFAYKLGMNDLPQSVAFFSAVDFDVCLRKEVDMDCKTPSNPRGLKKGYDMPEGESLDIYQILDITKGSLSPVSEEKSEQHSKIELKV